MALQGCALGDVLPYPRDDHARTTEDTPVVIRVLENDDGVATLSGLITPNGYVVHEGSVDTKHGFVTMRKDQTLLYTPARDFHGQDQFFYLVANDAGSARARVTIEVAADGEQFGDPIVLYESKSPLQAHRADLNVDGLADLVVEEGDRVVALVQGRDGSLRNVMTWQHPGCCPNLARRVLVADLDRDGLSDLVLFNLGHSLIIELTRPGETDDSVGFEEHLIDYVGPGSVALDAPVKSAWPSQGAVGDFDGDGELDLAVGFGDAIGNAMTRSHGAVIHLGMSRGVPRASLVFDVPGTAALASGDVTGDGIDDVIMAAGLGVVEVIHVDRGADRGFARSTTELGPSGSQVWLGVTDVDAVPGNEVVLSDGRRLAVLAGSHEDVGALVELWSTEIALIDIALADIDADGRGDLLGEDIDTSALELWRGTVSDGLPSLVFTADFPLSNRGDSLELVDFGGDGALDVLTSRFVAPSGPFQVIALPGRTFN
jgi:uncharacterized protein (DUF952 family)